LLNGDQLVSTTDEVPAFFTLLQHPFVKESAKILRSKQYRTIPNHARSLVILQREFAVCSAANNIDIIGTEDATTCHILVFRCRSTTKTALAHLDGSAQQLHSIPDMLALFSGQEKDEGLDVHVVGGFHDEDNDDRYTSEALSTSLFNVLCRCSVKLHLRTACVCELNTISDHRAPVNMPAIRGLSVEVRTGEIYPAQFVDRGPDLAVRVARSLTGPPELSNVYDASRSLLVIVPFPYSPLPSVHDALTMSDEQLLHFFSTSPQQEGPNFVSDLRRTFSFLAEHPNSSDYWREGSHAFERAPDGQQWQIRRQ